MVGVKVFVEVGVGEGVSVLGSGLIVVGVSVGAGVGASVAGGETGAAGLKKENSRIARRTIVIPIDNIGFLVSIEGSFLENFFNPVTDASGRATPSSPNSSLFKPVVYS